MLIICGGNNRIPITGCGLYHDKDVKEVGTDVRKWEPTDWLCKRCLKPTRGGAPLVDTGQFKRSVLRVIGR